MSLDRDIIEALATDMDANAALPVHTTYHGRPPALKPDDCPALVVWLDSKRPTPVTTEWFDAIYTIGISYHEASVDQAETLVSDEELKWVLSEARGNIEGRLRALAQTGIGVDAAWEVEPGESQYFGPPLQQGLTQGYAVECIVKVTENGG